MVVKDSNWRPEGWELPIWITDKSCKSEAKEEANIFEAGADAMLEAIQKHFDLTLLSLDYKGSPIVVKSGDRLVIGIKPESNEMPFFLSDICFNRDYILMSVSISAKELKSE